MQTVVAVLLLTVCGAHAQYSGSSVSPVTGATTAVSSWSVKAWIFNHVIYSTGACKVDHSDVNFKGIALGAALWSANGQAAACGTCVTVSANGNSVKATVFDKSDAPVETFISFAVYRALWPQVLCSSLGLPPLSDITVQWTAC
ncbi:hypothetical protein BV898_06915 [Hypsibius exemplaris]|uniref:Barwin domain-containing protein n=1 Tax=Hypsibius exemplaris TaxID=2072580 RepID=A0A1W0WV35_HYPEX|nr:hypothetical protein BV898_06915 [Hypsibius exemplaris]